ncbi:hypothetical protein ACFQZ8_14780, partial [Micromonospora azadirachtae]
DRPGHSGVARLTGGSRRGVAHTPTLPVGVASRNPVHAACGQRRALWTTLGLAGLAGLRRGSARRSSTRQ